MTQIVDVAGNECLSAVFRTCGEYQTEEESVAGLVSKLNKRHWTVHREVSGWMLHPRSFSDGKLNLRVDIILEPTEELLYSGWRWGPVPVECKKSSHNIGPAVCQAMDYTRCVWSLPNGYDVMSRLCFLWPFKPPGGTVASVMVNNRIGGAFLRDYKRDAVVLMFNSTVAYEDRGEQEPHIANDLRGGTKTGSR
jgi:hypothetical protein